MLLAVVAVAGCTRTFAKDAVQPNPLLNPTETLRNSQTITIITGDMELDQPVSYGCSAQAACNSASIAHSARYPLFNAASFTMVSRDRLRFHVQIDHKWEEWADLKTWEVYLLDDQGHRYIPESVEHAHTKVMTMMWDREQRRAICDSHGTDAKGDCLNTIGWDENPGTAKVMHQTLGTLSVFRGNADFVFYQRDIFTPELKWMKLVVKRSGEAFEFTWHFTDEVASSE